MISLLPGGRVVIFDSFDVSVEAIDFATIPVSVEVDIGRDVSCVTCFKFELFCFFDKIIFFIYSGANLSTRGSAFGHTNIGMDKIIPGTTFSSEQY